MKRLFLYLSVCAFLVGISGIARAEDSANAYEGKTRSYPVFVSALNTGGDVAVNSPMILAVDSTQTLGQAGTLGAYVRQTSTTDSVFFYGVSDEAITSGMMGRICIRGPHKVAMVNNLANQATGAILSTSTTLQKGGIYSTADGTAGGQGGILLSTTATTDTGDATNTFWFWVNPQPHK